MHWQVDQPQIGVAALQPPDRGGRAGGRVRRQDGRDYLPNPKDEQLAKLAGALGVTLEDLINFEHGGLRIGWYAHRPQTEASRRGEGLPGTRGRPRDEREQRLERLERLTERIADKLGVDLDELAEEADPEEAPPPRRRRGRAG
jgi:transcriptional regulator with XRE-family HTH domain